MTFQSVTSQTGWDIAVFPGVHSGVLNITPRLLPQASRVAAVVRRSCSVSFNEVVIWQVSVAGVIPPVTQPAALRSVFNTKVIYSSTSCKTF